MSEQTLALARAYTDAGLCIIPIKTDGTKAPTVAVWKQYQDVPPGAAAVQEWWGNAQAPGIAVIWGKVSGNGEALDFDAPGLYEDFAALCEQQGLGDLVNTCLLVETPSGGRHLLYRCETPVQGNRKLAQRLDTDTGAIETLIETRGEGGYTIAPGSPLSCHPDNKPYTFLRGRPKTLPTITGEQRTLLLALAASFNEYVKPEAMRREPKTHTQESVGLSPGDDYNARGDYESLLERHGWQHKGGHGGKTLWQRPGKTGPGISATSNYGGRGLLHVFSSNAAPFEPEQSYSPFGVYALLEHGGDYSAAAKELGRQGYGTPLPPPVCARVVEAPSAGASGQDTPPEWEPPVPFTAHRLPAFPVEALPDLLREMAEEEAVASKVPVDMPAMTTLGVVSTAGGRRCRVRIGATHTEPMNLWCAVVMEPGSRKSAMMTLTGPLREYEAGLIQAAKAEQGAAKARRAIEDKRLSHLQESAAKDKSASRRAEITREAETLAAELTEVPALPRLLIDDITPEKVPGFMAENAGAIALFSPEGGIFVNLTGGRSSKGELNIDAFLKGHAGDEIRVDRVGRPPEYVKRPALSMGLLIQPDVLTSLADTPSLRGRGFLARFLYALPPSLAGTRMYENRPVDPDARRRYNRAIERILDLPDAGTEDDPSQRHTLLLTGEALSVWAKYHDAVEKRLAEGEDLCGIRDWASKLAGGVARIAGGFHLVENAGGDWQKPISVETVAAAWAIGEYLIAHALAAFGEMRADPRLALAQRVLGWIERKGLTEFTLRECQQAHKGGRALLTTEELQPALAVLTEHGYIRASGGGQATGGRPGSASYAVNPGAHNANVNM